MPLRADQVVAGDGARILQACAEDFERFAGSRFLITGGAGFLGHALTHAIACWNERSAARERIELILVDNFTRGMPAWLRRLAHRARIRLVPHDVTQPLPEALGVFHYILHAASIASPSFYRQHPIETMDANVQGLRHLLEHGRRRMETAEPLRGLLFFSSSEIYGDPSPESIPTPEGYRGFVSCTGPRACYDESKRYGETLCVNFARRYGVPVTIVRPFNNYGPGLRLSDGRVIADFARDILAGRDIAMFSDGAPTRTFCYVANAAAGYFQALGRGRPGEAYNIGVEQPEISVAGLAERMIAIGREMCGYRGRLTRTPSADRHYLADSPNRRCPDITKARTELGYRPGTSLEEGLRRTLCWCRENREEDAER